MLPVLSSACAALAAATRCAACVTRAWEADARSVALKKLSTAAADFARPLENWEGSRKRYAVAAPARTPAPTARKLTVHPHFGSEGLTVPNRTAPTAT